jgi:hypothetical protein
MNSASNGHPHSLENKTVRTASFSVDITNASSGCSFIAIFGQYLIHMKHQWPFKLSM